MLKLLQFQLKIEECNLKWFVFADDVATVNGGVQGIIANRKVSVDVANKGHAASNMGRPVQIDSVLTSIISVVGSMLLVGADRATRSSGPVVERHARPWEIEDSERVVNVLNTCRNGVSHHHIIEGTMTQISEGESVACAITHAELLNVISRELKLGEAEVYMFLKHVCEELDGAEMGVLDPYTLASIASHPASVAWYGDLLRGKKAVYVVVNQETAYHNHKYDLSASFRRHYIGLLGIVDGGAVLTYDPFEMEAKTRKDKQLAENQANLVRSLGEQLGSLMHVLTGTEAKDYVVHAVKHGPRQQDAKSCGYYACYWGLHVATYGTTPTPRDFTTLDLVPFRRFMAQTIIDPAALKFASNGKHVLKIIYMNTPSLRQHASQHINTPLSRSHRRCSGASQDVKICCEGASVTRLQAQNAHEPSHKLSGVATTNTA